MTEEYKMCENCKHVSKKSEEHPCCDCIRNDGEEEMSYEDKDIYIVTNGIISTHGDTKVKAMSDFRYKLDCEKENIEVVEKIKSTGMVSKDDYRKITGACEFGTNDFCERHNITEDEVSIDRVLELLSDNDFGSVKFKNYFEK